jgi:hypothetical protein
VSTNEIIIIIIINEEEGRLAKYPIPGAPLLEKEVNQ